MKGNTGLKWVKRQFAVRSVLKVSNKSEKNIWNLYNFTKKYSNVVQVFLLFNNLFCCWWWWWWIVFVVWLTDERRVALSPAGTIVRDPHHLESQTRREQDLNLRRTRVQAVEWSCAVAITTTPRRHWWVCLWNYFVRSIKRHCRSKYDSFKFFQVSLPCIWGHYKAFAA